MLHMKTFFLQKFKAKTEVLQFTSAFVFSAYKMQFKPSIFKHLAMVCEQHALSVCQAGITKHTH